MNKIISAGDGSLLRSQVFLEIEKAILDGNLVPGDSLNELKLSQQLGVSRTPIREALRQLDLEGLVKTIPNKGAIVVGVSQKDIEDIYNLRIILEGLAAKSAAENIAEKELEQLENVVELQEFYSAKKDYLQVWLLDTKFHEIIFSVCNNRILNHTLLNFHHYIQKARELSFETSGRSTAATSEHRKIFEAIKNHDGASAEVLAAQHVQFAKDNFLEKIKK